MEFSIAIDIEAPPEVVWEVMADVARWPEWTPSVTSIRLLDGAPLRVGSRAVVRQPRFPPALWTVTSVEAGRGFTWRSGAPGVRVYAHHSVTAVERGSQVALSLKYEGVLGRLLARMTRAVTLRYLGFEAAGLKRRSEERAASARRGDPEQPLDPA